MNASGDDVVGLTARGTAAGAHISSQTGNGEVWAGYGDVGIHASGGVLAGDFLGDVQVSGALKTPSGGSVAVRDLCVVLSGSGTCDVRNAIQAVGRAGVPTTLDWKAMPGGYLYTSIAIGRDGRPVISYDDPVSRVLKFARCIDPTCAAATLRTLSAGSDPRACAIAVGADGNPVISHISISSSTTSSLNIVRCDDPDCATTTIGYLDWLLGAVGTSEQLLSTSIAVGSDGNPVVSYYDYRLKHLNVAKCHDPVCASKTLSTVDGASYVGCYASITVGADGLPVISYNDLNNGGLKVAKCVDGGCTSATLRIVDSAGYNTGRNTSIAIGGDGNPVITYNDEAGSTSVVKVATCSDPSCTGATLRTLDTGDRPRNRHRR